MRAAILTIGFIMLAPLAQAQSYGGPPTGTYPGSAQAQPYAGAGGYTGNYAQEPRESAGGAYASNMGTVGQPNSSQPDPSNCGTPDEPKPCPPMPRHPLNHYPGDRR
jgi:hypothetical protein